MKFLKNLKKKNLSGKIGLLRVDFDIKEEDLRGLAKKRHPRISSVLATIEFLVKKRAKVVILSHRGRPAPLKRGISNSIFAKRIPGGSFLISKKFSLKPFVKILSVLLNKPVKFVSFGDLQDFEGVRKKIEKSTQGSIFLLENLRFFPEEQKNSKKFARQLAGLGDFYVNNAFGVSHRNNASVVAIAEFLPSYAGLALENEIKTLSRVIKKARKPLVIILGGVKVPDKIGVIKNFVKKADYFLIGGGVANTFFAAEKLLLGNSLYDKKMISLARRLLKVAGNKIILPIDSVVKNGKILDIGPETAKMYAAIIKKAKTVIWSGPMGKIEQKEFSQGTEEIIKAIMKSRGFSIIGGGETTSLVLSIKYQVSSRVFVSAGGGAMLDFLAGKEMPAIEALK